MRSEIRYPEGPKYSSDELRVRAQNYTHMNGKWREVKEELPYVKCKGMEFNHSQKKSQPLLRGLATSRANGSRFNSNNSKVLTIKQSTKSILISHN